MGKEVKLDIDTGDDVGKTTMHVLLKEIVKLHEQQQLKTSLGIQDEEILRKLQNIHNRDRNPGHKPFLLTLAINDLFLHNCMLDSGACANITPLTIMNQFGLNINRPYKRGCSFNSKPVEVEGFIK